MSSDTNNTPYRVLARKYRPSTFDELIGHEAMVQTLSNALEAGRLAHAFILTGTRGIGKTTTARIIARGLNCTGADGKGGPTIAPCGVCQNCISIAEDRHQDVLEMDAASRTGVDDIRELIDGVRYLPVSARFKIYIIDEVHMLSKNAFNALLKTLEEPPEHVKFIFATTEIRKIPVTVLSRCQRFDLKRVDGETLAAYFASIAAKEDTDIGSEALALIARAAEGSVRDGLSLLDQAIAHGDGVATAAQVRDMLGLADRTQIVDLLSQLMAGDIKASLALLRAQYDSGADPVVIIQDLLEMTHWLTSMKVTPEAANNVAMAAGDVTRGQELAEKLTMPVLARTWQMLLKGLDEVRSAPMPLAAAEMILVRLAYVSDMPTPEDLARQLDKNNADSHVAPSASSNQPRGNSLGNGTNSPSMVSAGSGRAATALATSSLPNQDSEPRAHLSLVSDNNALPEMPSPAVTVDSAPMKELQSLEDIVSALSDRADIKLKGEVTNFIRPVKFEQGLIEYSPAPGAGVDLAARLGVRLRAITGKQWIVRVSSNSEGAPTVAEKRRSDKAAEISEIESHPIFQNIKTLFPGAAVREVRHLGPTLDSLEDDSISDADDMINGDDF